MSDQLLVCAGCGLQMAQEALKAHECRPAVVDWRTESIACRCKDCEGVFESRQELMRHKEVCAPNLQQGIEWLRHDNASLRDEVKALAAALRDANRKLRKAKKALVGLDVSPVKAKR